MQGVHTKKKMADSGKQNDEALCTGDGEKTGVHSSPVLAESMDVSTPLNSDVRYFFFFFFLCFLKHAVYFTYASPTVPRSRL